MLLQRPDDRILNKILSLLRIPHECARVTQHAGDLAGHVPGQSRAVSSRRHPPACLSNGERDQMAGL